MGLPAKTTKTIQDDEPTLLRKAPKAPRIDDVIGGKYRLVRELGRGGMGRIFEADHLLLRTKVALKFMHPHLTSDPISVTRFCREARAAATLTSEHSARILDVDLQSGGELYIVMEYLEGSSLETLAKNGTGLPIADAVKFIAQACEALGEAHDLGIIHRDVKPANLFVTKRKSGETMIKVLDFGLAKSNQPDTFAAGKVQALGTPQYMSPEQMAAAEDLDGRSDVWSLGATLYELLTGRPAFAAKGPFEVFARIIKGDMVPLRMLRPEVSPALVAIIDRCLARDRAARFADVRALAHALASLGTACVTPVKMNAVTLPIPTVTEVSAPSAPVTEVSAPVRPAIPSSCARTLVSPSDPLIPSAPAAPPHVTTWSSIAPIAITYAPPPMPSAMPASSALAGEPTLRQTVLAALAGPLLVAVAAGVMAVMLATGPAHAASGAANAAAHAASADHLTAKSSAIMPRAKAPERVSLEATVAKRRAR